MIRTFILASAVWAATALAQQPSPRADADQRAPFAQEFVNQRLEIWKARLGLKTWKITVIMSRRSEMKPRTLGGIHWDKKQKTAEMQVLDASEYHVAPADMLKDMEFTVVHELIHLELASLPRSEASRSDEEQAVNLMATALLNLDRQATSSVLATGPCQLDVLASSESAAGVPVELAR